MNDILDIESIIKRKKYPKIYNIGIILVIIILMSCYVIFTYKYHSYYHLKGKMIHNKLELYVDIKDIKYIENNHIIEIDKQEYSYTIDSISDELYVDDNYNNYRCLYLNVNNLANIDNYVYEVKIFKESKVIAKYLKEYL